MRLEGPRLQSTLLDSVSVGRVSYLRVTVPCLLDRFVTKFIYPSLGDQLGDARGRYSRAVRVAIQARLDCSVEAPLPPGTFVEEMLDATSRAGVIANRLDDYAVLRGLARHHIDFAANNFVWHRDLLSDDVDPIEEECLARAQDELETGSRAWRNESFEDLLAEALHWSDQDQANLDQVGRGAQRESANSLTR